ncbi:MAG: IS110 family transposase [Deltaproteobacteria bacterium]|nr:IS110 family transposase [Deltaproteobacteria bacterium]
MNVYKTFSHDLGKLADHEKQEGVELAVMESTGIYWKTVYAALEDAGINVLVVNALHVKKVSGRKTDVTDSEWLAELGRCGLLRPSLIFPRDIREIRLMTRYRVKMVGYLAGQKNRLHKVLDDCGVRLGSVVSDIDGVSARRMIDALIKGDKTPEEIAGLACGQLHKKEKDIILSLESNISDRHRFLLRRVWNHIRFLEKEIEEMECQIVAAMKPYEQEWRLVQTIPGIDEIGAAIW